MKKQYKSIISFFMAFLLIISIGLPASAASLISDPNLEKAIREIVGIQADKELTEEDLSTLHEIYNTSEVEKIQSLSGLESAINLSSVAFPANHISDLTPLQNLNKLEDIYLPENNISDIRPLGNLTKGSFPYLDLSTNQISDIQDFSELTETYYLNLSNNKITDINALNGLTVHEMLDLSHNKINNVGSLSNLNITGGLYLSNNEISNIDALGSITVTDYVYLDVSNNQINSLDALKNIKVTDLYAGYNNIESIEGLGGKHFNSLELNNNNLSSLDGLKVVEDEDIHYSFDFSDNKISDITALSNIQFGFIDLSNNLITDISALQNLQEPSIVDLSGNPLDESSQSIISTLIERDVEVTYDPITPIQRDVERVKGSNRQATAVEISKQGWETAETVIISRGDNFPDALAGAPLAYELDAPILLAGNDTLTTDSINEIKRLGAKKAILLGGTGAIPKSIENELKELGVEFERIAGSTRFETAKLIAEKMETQSNTAVVAYGFDFPDALAVASYAAKNNMPILLTEKDRIPAETQEVLKNKTNTIVVGGKGVISENVFKQLPGAQRISGQNRYETAANLLKDLNVTPQKVFVANGMGFADALTGSVLAAKWDASLLLVDKNSLPVSIKNVMIQKDINDVIVLGGTVAVSDSVVNEIAGK